MVAIAEQSIFEWQLESSKYSGDESVRTKAAVAYSLDIAKLTKHAGGDEFSKHVTFHTSPQRERSTQQAKVKEIASRLSSLDDRTMSRPRISRTATLTPIQEWEGYVESINETSFFVKLTDIRDGSGLPMDEGEFELRELSKADQARIEVGSIVRWVIGLERLANDQRQRVSRLHLRRLPVFTSRDIERAFDEADTLLNGLTWDVAT